MLMETQHPEVNKVMEDLILRMINDPINNPVISDTIIREYNNRGLLVEEPLEDHQVQANSIDLTLGHTWKLLLPNAIYFGKESMEIGSERHMSFRDQYPELVLGDGLEIIDPRFPMRFKQGRFNEKGYLVDPGQFVLFGTKETLNIPQGIVTIICGRSSIARLGIQTEQAGFVDAGFRGTITLEVHNQTEIPIILYPGMRVAQAYSIKAQYAERLYGKALGSKYKDQVDATESKAHLDKEFNSGGQ